MATTALPRYLAVSGVRHNPRYLSKSSAVRALRSSRHGLGCCISETMASEIEPR